ncbi:transposase family protein [Streptomyces sp. NPDC058420]|uniref:transposase family protein n=1 Tax=Streptomyces sp. NPDC058420 TaxID=3346489 RepID=UPI0036470A94
MKRINEPAGDTGFPVYQCRLPVSRRTNEYCTDLLSRHLKKIGSRWRALPPGRIVIIMLAVLRHDQRTADMAGGNAVGDTTVRRWRDELISLLAARAPRLDRACKKIAKRCGEVVLIDGTLIPTVRRIGAANRPNYSGRHRRHGLHFLALTHKNGRLIWISAARPGRTHDITAARRDHILTHLRAAGLGFLGLTDDSDDPVIVTGYKATRARKLTPGEKQANRVLAAAHAPVEHGFAHLKTWRILTKLRTDPAHATDSCALSGSFRTSSSHADR